MAELRRYTCDMQEIISKFKESIWPMSNVQWKAFERYLTSKLGLGDYDVLLIVRWLRARIATPTN
jgi:hypothetical protein